MLRVFGFLAAAVTAFAVSAPAHADLAQVQTIENAAMMEAAAFNGLNWKVGDRTNHKIDGAGGMLKGTSDQFVREDTGAAYWLENNVDMGMMGKQKVEILINKSTGQVEKILVNGKEQQAPENNNEVVEMKEARVKVTAGEFECVYVKLKDKKSNAVTEAWLNPKLIPMMGLIKAIQESQFGPITQELVSFQRGN